MSDGDTGLGHHLAYLGGGVFDVHHPVVHEEDLAFAQQLAANGFGDGTIALLADVGQDWLAFRWRGLQQGHVTNACETHLQGSWHRRCGEGQDVDVGLERLDRLLVLHTEALLFVHDEQPQVFELQLGVEHSVGADQHVDLAVVCVLDDRLGLGVGEEAAQDLNTNGEAREPFGEGLMMLLGEQGCRHQDRGLLAALHGLERGSHCDLGLAESHIAYDEPVHWVGPLHVGLHISDGRELVGGLLVGERIFEFTLERRVFSEGVTGRGDSALVEHDELLGDLADF